MPRIPQNVEALLQALRFRDPQSDGLRQLSESQWTDLLGLCDLMHLTLPLARAYSSALPVWVRTRIERNYSDNSAHFERVKAAYTEAAHAFHENGIEFLVIKGFTHYPDFVDDPRLRLQCDVDFVVLRKSVFVAQKALLRLGYVSDKTLVDWGYDPEADPEHLPCDHLPGLSRKTDWLWKGNFFDPEIPVGMELHFRLWDEPLMRLKLSGLEEFWNRRVQRSIEGIQFASLHQADRVGYVALHLLSDLQRGALVLKGAYELAGFLHRTASDDALWQTWQNQHDDDLRETEAVGFCLAKGIFPCEISPCVVAELDRLPAAIHQWFKEFALSPVERIFSPNKDSVWLHVAMLKSPRDQIAAIRQGLVPGRVPPVDVPGRDTNKRGEQRRFWPSHRYAKYLSYITLRIVHHSRALVSSLMHGLQWWLGSRGLEKDFWIFFAASFCFDLGGFIFFLLFNLYLADMGFTQRTLGWVMGAMSAGTIAGSLPAGVLAQRIGIRKSLLFCFAFVSGLSVLRATLTAEHSQLAFAFLSGAAMSIWAVCLSPALAQLTSEKARPFAFSLVFSTGIGIGVLGGLVGGYLPAWVGHALPAIGSAYSMKIALFIAAGIVALGLWPTMQMHLPHSFTRESKLYPRGRFMLRYLPAIGVWSLVTGSLGPFFNLYFSQHLHMDVPRIGVVFSVAQLAQVVAILLSPLIYRRFGLIAGIMYTQFATALALAGLASAPVASIAALVYTGYMAFQWMSEPGMYSLLMGKVQPSERSGASALNFLVISSASAVATVLAGEGITRFGYPTVIRMTAALAFVAALLFGFLLRDVVSEKEGSKEITASSRTAGEASLSASAD